MSPSLLWEVRTKRTLGAIVVLFIVNLGFDRFRISIESGY